MQSRRDQVQAYQFAVARLTGAACAGDAVSGETPARRSHQGVLFGSVLGSLLCAGLAVYGLISPKPSTAWKNPGAIIVDEANGTRYVYLDGRLRPTANYASALLIAGAQASVQLVSGAQLSGIPAGPAIGIPGAPDSVPPAADLLPGAWAVCVGSSLYLDLAPSGRATALPPSSELLVEPSSGGTTEYVVWGATRYPVPDQAVLPALGLGTRAPVRVPAAWLDQLAQGPALVPAAVPRAGRPGPAVAGSAAHVGQTFEITGAGAVQYYVLRSDGLEAINRTEAALYSAVPGAPPALPLTPAQFAAAPVSADHALLGELPDVMSGTAYPAAGTQPGSADPALCVLQKTPGRPADSVLATEPAAADGGVPVLVPPGRGMLVGDARTKGVSLVADDGAADPVSGTEALNALGYASAAVQVLPDEVLALIPAGPVLDPAAALRTAAAP